MGDPHQWPPDMDNSIYAEPKIDCHCHVLDPERFAYAPDVAYRPAGQEVGSADYFAQVLDAYGARHALLVGPNSGYGQDNRCLLDAIARGRGRFKGIAVAPLNASLDQLQELKAQGIVGIAFNAALLGVKYYAGLEPLLERIHALGMFAQMQAQGDQWTELAPMLLNCGAQVLIDHCGRPDLSHGVGRRGFQALLGMAESQRTFVKLSGFVKFSGQEFPFADSLPFARALMQAFGPSHCLWASDWPFLKAERRLDIGPLLQLFTQQAPQAADRRQILWDTPLHLFGFDANARE